MNRRLYAKTEKERKKKKRGEEKKWDNDNKDEG